MAFKRVGTGIKEALGFYLQGSSGWAEHIIFEFLHHNEPRKIMILGAGYSSCSTVVAALVGLEPWAIPQVQCDKKIGEGNRKGMGNIYLQFSEPVASERKLIKLLPGFVLLSI